MESNLSNFLKLCYSVDHITLLTISTAPSLVVSCADPGIFVRGGPTPIKRNWGERGYPPPPPKKKKTTTGNYRSDSETPLESWRFAGEPATAHIDCWLDSFVFFRGFGPVLLGSPINFVIFQGGGGGRGSDTLSTPRVEISMCKIFFHCVLKLPVTFFLFSNG